MLWLRGLLQSHLDLKLSPTPGVTTRIEGTHGVLVSDDPLRVLVVNMPGLAAGPDVSLQLTLLHKLAAGAAR